MPGPTQMCRRLMGGNACERESRSATSEERKRGGVGGRRLTLQCTSEKVTQAEGVPEQVAR